MSTETAPRFARILDLHPALGADLDVDAFPDVARVLTAPVVTVAAGPWDPAALGVTDVVRGRPFAVLIDAGVLMRDMLLADRVSSTLYGPHDLLGLREQTEPSLEVTSRWTAVTPVELLVLDDRFLRAVQRWPRLVARLMDAVAAQAGRACAQQAISQLPRVEDRIVALFWQLADRWGRVGPDGVSLDLPLTHRAIGRLVGAQRSTVSLGLQVLAADGRLVRRTDGGWLLDPDLARVAKQRDAHGPPAHGAFAGHGPPIGRQTDG
jgi:CRP/FNR family transcriptional regulator, cyclic AMP receptor protein